MREIKFRGKDDQGQWNYGNLVRYTEDDGEQVTCIVSTARNEISAEVVFVPVDENSVQQFTCLHDKNGNEIYEGDILELVVTYKGKPVKSPRIRKVVWKNSGFCIVNKHNDCVCERSVTCEDLEYTVIGNIYDNHDLI